MNTTHISLHGITSITLSKIHETELEDGGLAKWVTLDIRREDLSGAQINCFITDEFSFELTSQ